MKRFILLNNEQEEQLGGDFYITDGWIAFSSKEYDKAEQLFNTAIETNYQYFVIHILASIGLGWTNLYRAFDNHETATDGLVEKSGHNFYFADSIIKEISGYENLDNLTNND